MTDPKRLTLADLIAISNAAARAERALTPYNPWRLWEQIHYLTEGDGKESGGLSKRLQEIAADPARCADLAYALGRLGLAAQSIRKVELDFTVHVDRGSP